MTSVNTNAFTWDPSLDAIFYGRSGAESSYGHSETNSSFGSVASTPHLGHNTPTFQSSSDHISQLSPIGSDVATSPMHQGQPSPAPTMYKCMWGNCQSSFTSLSELVGHVNLQHLRLPSSTIHEAHQQQQLQQQQASTTVFGTGSQIGPGSGGIPGLPNVDALSCLWADCQVYPTPQTIPGPSRGNALDSALDILASHLMQDHLGLPTGTRSPRTISQTLRSASDHQVVPVAEPKPHPASALPAIGGVQAQQGSLVPLVAPPTPIPEHDCLTSAHVCKWTGCGQSFASCDALTAHIAAVHVGGGKAHYECFWEGCNRNGENGFASKQKISRHLQVRKIKIYIRIFIVY